LSIKKQKLLFAFYKMHIKSLSILL